MVGCIACDAALEVGEPLGLSPLDCERTVLMCMFPICLLPCPIITPKNVQVPSCRDGALVGVTSLRRSNIGFRLSHAVSERPLQPRVDFGDLLHCYNTPPPMLKARICTVCTAIDVLIGRFHFFTHMLQGGMTPWTRLETWYIKSWLIQWTLQNNRSAIGCNAVQPGCLAGAPV